VGKLQCSTCSSGLIPLPCWRAWPVLSPPSYTKGLVGEQWAGNQWNPPHSVTGPCYSKTAANIDPSLGLQKHTHTQTHKHTHNSKWMMTLSIAMMTESQWRSWWSLCAPALCGPGRSSPGSSGFLAVVLRRVPPWTLTTHWTLRPPAGGKIDTKRDERAKTLLPRPDSAF
jgi:hypothetical protein